MKVGLLVLGIGLLVAFCVWFEYSLWQECRVDHSWFYCMRVLSK